MQGCVVPSPIAMETLRSCKNRTAICNAHQSIMLDVEYTLNSSSLNAWVHKRAVASSASQRPCIPFILSRPYISILSVSIQPSWPTQISIFSPCFSGVTILEPLCGKGRFCAGTCVLSGRSSDLVLASIRDRPKSKDNLVCVQWRHCDLCCTNSRFPGSVVKAIKIRVTSWPDVVRPKSDKHVMLAKQLSVCGTAAVR